MASAIDFIMFILIIIKINCDSILIGRINWVVIFLSFSVRAQLCYILGLLTVNKTD